MASLVFRSLVRRPEHGVVGVRNRVRINGLAVLVVVTGHEVIAGLRVSIDVRLAIHDGRVAISLGGDWTD